jgi:MFS family permease
LRAAPHEAAPRRREPPNGPSREVDRYRPWRGDPPEDRPTQHGEDWYDDYDTYNDYPPSRYVEPRGDRRPPPHRHPWDDETPDHRYPEHPSHPEFDDHRDRRPEPTSRGRDGHPRQPPPRGRHGGNPHAAGQPDQRGASSAEAAGAEPPRKITVTRVAAWRSRQLTQQGIAAFRRAATADGADRSGLTALTFPVMASNAADAALAVALANTLFFSAATAESKTKVALYLLITVAPFALVAPVIGPLLDRLQRGRRLALSASFAGRALLAVVMARHFGDWLLYPAALGFLVLTRSFGLLKAAVTPRVLPPQMTLTKTNSRLAVFGLGAGFAVGVVAAGFAWAFGSGGSLWFTAAVCAVGAWLCLRIPAWVEVTEGEVPTTLLARGDGHEPPPAGRRRREPLTRHVMVALWGNATIRMLTGFLTLFVAFVVKAQADGSAWMQVVVLGLVGTAAGLGNVAGNTIGARQHFVKPDQVILTCLVVVLGAALVATVIGSVTSAIAVGLVGSTCSSLAKVCQDAVIQRDMPEESRASAFGRTETVLQLAWTLGGALGVLLPPIYWLGFAVISALLALGLAQTALAHRGRTLLRWPQGQRPQTRRLFGRRPVPDSGAPDSSGAATGHASRRARKRP